MKIRPRPLQMFSNFVGGFLTYFSNRWDISGSTLTLIKWVGLLTGIGGYLLGRLVANCFGHPYINIGVSAGGGARGLKNPFGGTSPFHMVLKAADKAGVQELVQLIRSTRRASQIGVISTELADAEEKDVENASRSTAVHLDLLDEKTASLQAEMREVEKAVLDEADMRMLAIRGVFKQLDVNADGSLAQKELDTGAAAGGALYPSLPLPWQRRRERISAFRPNFCICPKCCISHNFCDTTFYST